MNGVWAARKACCAMIRILADTPGDSERINQAIGGTGQVLDTAGGLTAGDHDTDCLIVACRRPFLPERIDLLAEIELMLPWVPVILVTDRDAGVARLLSNVRVSALVWFADVENQLQSRIEAACATTMLAHLASRLQRSALPPALRQALAYSLRKAGGTPVRSVKQLAADVRSSPVTLSHAFSARVQRRTTLSRFLGGLVILRAQQLRLSGSSWGNASDRLGFARATLNRKARRWPGCTLRELERLAPDQLLAAFVSEFVQPLLDDD